MTNYYTLAEKYIVDASHRVAGGDAKHYLQTVHWILVLRPSADEALQIAAVAHDCERLFRDKNDPIQEVFKNSKLGFMDPEYLTYHQKKGAQIMHEYLKTQHAPDSLISRVEHLISKHEVGGDEDQNLLMNADSISFFECNGERFATDKVKTEGYDKVKEKIDWMYTRITTTIAKQLAKPFYDSTIEKLEENK